MREHLAEVIDGCGLDDPLIEARGGRAAAVLFGFIARQSDQQRVWNSGCRRRRRATS